MIKSSSKIHCSAVVLSQFLAGACVWFVPTAALPLEQFLPSPAQISLPTHSVQLEFKKELLLPEPLQGTAKPQMISMPVVAKEAELPHILPSAKPEMINIPVVAKEAELPHILPSAKPQSNPDVDLLLDIAKSPEQSVQDMASMDLSSLVAPVVDSCVQQLKSTQSIKNCHDKYLDDKQGPTLIVFASMTDQSGPVAVSKYPITAQDYHLYCVLTKKCVDENVSSQQSFDDDLPVGLDLSDIEQSVDDYNRYCAISGNCPGVVHEENSDPVTNITYEQARAYSLWLSEQTQHVYRLPTKAEWDMLAMEQDYSSCLPLYYTNDNTNQFMENQLGLVLSPNLYQEWIFAVDTQGTVQLQTDEGCHVIFKAQHKKYHDTKTTFRLVREIEANRG